MNRILAPCVGLARQLGLTLAIAGLVACSSSPRTPDWQMNTKASTDKALDAYLSGNARVAQLEWDRARSEVARTGRADLLARLELMRCAAQVASLEIGPCTGYDALAQDAASAEQAYAAYLSGRVATAQIPLLPESQRGVAQVAPGTDPTPRLKAVDDPLSRLVAAGVLLQTGAATPAVVGLAVETASAQGWRRPLLAWLLVQVQRAEAAGDTQSAAALRRRMGLIEAAGQTPR